MNEVEQLQAEIKKLKTALEFYADFETNSPEEWECYGYYDGMGWVHDQGEVAQVALGLKKRRARIMFEPCDPDEEGALVNPFA